MRYLKENKLLVLLAILLIPAFYYDRAVMSWVREYLAFHDQAWYQPIDNVVKTVTHGSTLIILSLAVFLGARSFNRRLSDTGRAVFIGVITSGIAVQGFKRIIGRARPRVTLDSVFIGPSLHIDYDSFPSGHATVVFCLAFIITQYYPRYRLLFYLFALMTGLDRIFGLSHFPSDVLAGMILGTVTGKLLSAFAARPREGASRLPSSGPL